MPSLCSPQGVVILKSIWRTGVGWSAATGTTEEVFRIVKGTIASSRVSKAQSRTLIAPSHQPDPWFQDASVERRLGDRRQLNTRHHRP